MEFLLNARKEIGTDYVARCPPKGQATTFPNVSSVFGNENATGQLSATVGCIARRCIKARDVRIEKKRAKMSRRLRVADLLRNDVELKATSAEIDSCVGFRVRARGTPAASSSK